MREEERWGASPLAGSHADTWTPAFAGVSDGGEEVGQDVSAVQKNR